MTTLRGHSRPVHIPLLDNILDHTYVTCAAGHCWPCWGDCEDGAILRTGHGSSARAQAISEPRNQAGIRYGVTGLCTQTANRILWPAEVTVSDAMGYGITEVFFGTYGPSALDWIEHRDASAGVTGESPRCDGTEAPDENPADDAANALLSFLMGLYERLAGTEERRDRPVPNTDLLGRILEARVRSVLGEDFSRDRIRRLQDVQRGFFDEKVPLDEQVLTGAVAGREFAVAANRAINDRLRLFAEVLSEGAYARLFNVRPGAEVTVIRPDVCGDAYAGGPVP